METTAYDSKIIVAGKLKAGWRCIKECIPELGFYTGILSPFVIACNHFANAKPRMERAHKEALEEYGRAYRRLLSPDADEALCRDVMEADERRRKHIKELKRKIVVLKELKKREESHPTI
ncbi:hypothetical protein FNV43_RR14267 [Rhamnella rubrinervis]|uniref:Uncharacterized protein n=1 Tax=Rhamnella rubrinervis TaxID=2594499 RepID=A0A8K0MG70_9ROSA|nr:hypothetical protein FNV43_RR14267 [Rhamnella rubrinervis]